LLKRFLEGIKSYQKALGGRGKGANSWRKIGWGLFKADEVASFREKLSQHKQNITVFLNGLTIIVGASYADETKQISASINEGFMALQKRLPRSVGYGDGNLVTLVNPFGERLPLLWECCFSHERFHETLTTHFKGTCGEGHVERHDYSISTEDGRSLVQSGNWGSVVKKGTVLVMSMIVKKVALQPEDAGRQRNRCPRCYETDIGVMWDDGWLQCRRCKRRFSSEDRTVALRDPPPPDKSVTEFRNIRILLVERSLLWVELVELLALARRREKWCQAEAEEANRFVEIS
jgi:ribosomal protein S14